MTKLNDKLVIAISSRALFDLNASNEIYEKEGFEAYARHQRANEHNPLDPGFAYPLVKKFLALNQGKKEEDKRVEVLLLSRNTADTGLRIFHSIDHHGLDITRAAFTGGNSPYGYAKAFNAHLFLSLNPDDVADALSIGCPAANIWSGPSGVQSTDSLNIAFDGDAVLFSDESEEVFKHHGLEAFNHNETALKHHPMKKGPFAPFLEALVRLQNEELPIPIRTALVTARSAPSHERVVHTLREWGVRLDESLFLGGLEKVEFLSSFKADIFFDDQRQHCTNASTQISSAHVPFGVTNIHK